MTEVTSVDVIMTIEFERKDEGQWVHFKDYDISILFTKDMGYNVDNVDDGWEEYAYYFVHQKAIMLFREKTWALMAAKTLLEMLCTYINSESRDNGRVNIYVDGRYMLEGINNSDIEEFVKAWIKTFRDGVRFFVAKEYADMANAWEFRSLDEIVNALDRNVVMSWLEVDPRMNSVVYGPGQAFVLAHDAVREHFMVWEMLEKVVYDGNNNDTAKGIVPDLRELVSLAPLDRKWTTFYTIQVEVKDGKVVSRIVDDGNGNILGEKMEGIDDIVGGGSNGKI